MKRNRNFRPLLPAAVAFAALVCSAVSLTAPGRAAEATTQTRQLPTFDRIVLKGAFDSTIRPGTTNAQIIVTGNRDAIEHVTTEVRDGTLSVDMRGTNTIDGKLKLQISLPALRSFRNDGFGATEIVGLSGDRVDIVNSGAASIKASGRAKRLKISLDGTGKMDLTGVDARDVTVDNNGVGAVYVRASGSLAMNVNGVGEIRYAGNPAHVESKVNGIGRTGRM